MKSRGCPQMKVKIKRIQRAELLFHLEGKQPHLFNDFYVLCCVFYISFIEKKKGAYSAFVAVSVVELENPFFIYFPSCLPFGHSVQDRVML